jgi:hypothetical protein
MFQRFLLPICVISLHHSRSQEEVLVEETKKIIVTSATIDVITAKTIKISLLLPAIKVTSIACVSFLFADHETIFLVDD